MMRRQFLCAGIALMISFILPRSVRVSKLRRQREDLAVSITLFRPRSVISTASPWFRGISDRMYLRASNSAEMHAFQKAA